MAIFPFQRRPLDEPGLLDRLRKRPPKKNAVIELNNLLVNGVDSVSEADFVEIEQRYSLDLGLSFSDERMEMYRAYVEFCLAGDPLDAVPPELPRLRSLLRIAEEAAAPTMLREQEQRYRREVRERIADRRLDPGDRRRLDELQSALGLSDGTARAIQHDEADAVVRDYLNQLVEDAMLSPDEAAEFERSIASLGLPFKFTPEERARWNRYQQYWQLQCGPLPPVQVQVNLQKNETCFFAAPASWHERRQQTRSIRYSGPHARVRIAKGLYWRAGSADIQRVTQEVMHTVDDAGAIYFTNKRVLYGGRNRSTNLRLNRILDFEVYSDGIELLKDAGRNPIFMFETDIDIAALVLDRLLTNDPPPDQPARSHRVVEVESSSQRLPASPETRSSGLLDGTHYTEYVEEIKQLKRERRHDEALNLLNRIIDIVEGEFEATGQSAPPWYFEQVAIIHRKEKDYHREITVLQRYEAIRKRQGSPPDTLTERLVSAQALALSQS